jgi:ribosomal protein S27AE
MHDTIPCPPPLPSDTERCPAPTERCPAWYALEDARSEYDAAKAQQGFCPSCGRHGTFLGVQEGLVHWNCGRVDCPAGGYSYECGPLLSMTPEESVPTSKTG